MSKFWNERYGTPEYAYGKEPNEFFKEQLLKLTPGKILLAAEGEGRNAVFAATQGWQADAFDTSTEGKKKAELLAKENQVHINYQVGDLPSLKYKPEEFDAIGLIYAHFPVAIRSAYHQLLSEYLKKGGTIILEAFSKKHLQYNSVNEKVGGPKDIDVLFSVEEVLRDFSNYEIIESAEKEIELQEGSYHNGTGAVIRYVGRKK